MAAEVQVFLTDVPNNDSTQFRKMLRVKVRSHTRRDILSHVDLELTTKNMRHQVGIAAGAIAEQHAQKYRDPSDPGKVADIAQQLYDRLGLAL